MLLNGFGFSGYRSFGDELAKVAPLEKINLIIGRNNSGKSNVIRFLFEHYVEYVENMHHGGNPFKRGLDGLDIHKSQNPAKLRVAFPVYFGEELKEYVRNYLTEFNADNIVPLLLKQLRSNGFCDANNFVWLVFATDALEISFTMEYSRDDAYNILDSYDWLSIWNQITGQRIFSHIGEHWIPETIKTVISALPTTPNIQFIPAIRKIGEGGTTPDDFSGIGIIERLMQLQSPSLDDYSLKEDFEAINRFVQEVLERPDARIEIPNKRDMVIVNMDGKPLPLSSLGTGIHEVIILATAATVLKDTVLCVEEPELHLHPLLQRKLLHYLYDKKDNNQYIFTTHSAHLLDAVPCQIFHVTHDGNGSFIFPVESSTEKSNICSDLGYRASDILQANCVIWVEGPSDRIYLNYWLKHWPPGAEEEFIEGIHYAIMFYGGRLASHLSGLDPEAFSKTAVEGFISLRALNRYSAIVMDSDKDHADSPINATKKRLRDEFDADPDQGFAWVTEGREIENYLSEEQLEESVSAVHPSAEGLADKGSFSNLLKYRVVGGQEPKAAPKAANKLEVARHYTGKFEPDFGVLDLKARIERLCGFIGRANGNRIG